MGTNSITNGLMQKAIEAISQKTGMDEKSAKKMAENALPKIIEGLQNNTKDSKKAKALEKAISEDHDGSILDNLGNIDLQDGQKIISHIFGSETSKVTKSVGNSDVLSAIAPVVLGSLGKQSNTTGKSVTDLLNKDSSLLSIAKGFLDKDGDGDIKDDLLDMAMNFVKGKNNTKKK